MVCPAFPNIKNGQSLFVLQYLVFQEKGRYEIMGIFLLTVYLAFSDTLSVQQGLIVPGGYEEEA